MYRLKSLGLISLTLLLSTGIPILVPALNLTPQLAVAQTIEERKAEGEGFFAEALQLYEQGKIKEALEVFQKALTIFQEIGDRYYEAWTLSGIGLMYYNLEQPGQALKHYEQALNIIREIKDRQGEGIMLNSIGLVYRKLGQYEQALKYYQQALAIAKAVDDRSNEGAILNNIGSVYESLSQYEQALEYYKQALAINQEVGDRSAESVILNSIGLIYRKLGQYEQALKYYQQGLAIHQEAGDRASVGTTLNNIGSVYQGLGQYEQALNYYGQALAISKEVGDRFGEGTTLSNIGLVYDSLGKYEQALDYLQKALVIHKEVGNRPMESTTLHNIGLVYDHLGKYEQALNYYQQALVINKEVGDQFGEGTILNNIGSIYQNLGKYEQALDYYQQALAIHKKVGNKPVEGTTLNNIGLVYDNLGKYEQALNYFQQALAIFKEVGDRPDEGTALNNIGYIYDRLGKYEQALDYYQQALAISKEVGNRAGEGETLNNIGAVYQSLAKYEQALDYYQQALAIHKEIGNRAVEGITLNNIGYVLESQNQPELAIIFFKQSVNTYELIRKDIKGLPTEDQESYTKTIESVYRTLADLLLSQNRIYEAQRVLDLLKVQEINDYLQETRGNENTQQGMPLSSTEQQIWANYQDLVNQAVAYGKELSELRKIKPQDRTPAQNQRILELKNAESFLVKDFNNFINSPEVLKAIENVGSGTDEEDIKQRLGELDDLTDKLSKLNAAIIYPFILEDRIELIITTSYSPPTRRTVQVSQKELNETILKFRDALKNPNSDPKPLANQLYQWLIQPLENDLKTANVTTIIYAPDGQLRYIPLAALYDGKQWLIERYQVNHITAASLKTIDTQPQGELQILAGAVTQAYRLQIGQETFDLAALPYAGKEIATLADMIPDTVQLLDTNFSVEQTQIMMEGSTIIHFATHAAIVVGSPEESFILFGNGERATLEQVENWKFNNVDLVVLSACETAVGGNLGDGREILGFGYLMQAAGAKAAIASLWSVSDGGTQALMTTFYSMLQEPETSKSEALQKAQITLITGNYEALGEQRGLEVRERIQKDVPANVNSRLSHPYYWAPFILIGNGL